jgi:polyketide cyclase/dehydrase/lipid transport protein
MAKFPTDVDESLTIAAPPEHVYAFLWDVVGSSGWIPDLATCERAGPDTYRFVSKERAAGPVTMVARYTARYEGNGADRITFESIPVEDDNTDVRGTLVLERTAGDGTRVRLTQTIAPDTPVPRLLQGLLRSFVQGEAVAATRGFLGNVRRALDAA